MMLYILVGAGLLLALLVYAALLANEEGERAEIYWHCMDAWQDYGGK